MRLHLHIDVADQNGGPMMMFDVEFQCLPPIDSVLTFRTGTSNESLFEVKVIGHNFLFDPNRPGPGEGNPRMTQSRIMVYTRPVNPQKEDKVWAAFGEKYADA